MKPYLLFIAIIAFSLPKANIFAQTKTGDTVRKMENGIFKGLAINHPSQKIVLKNGDTVRYLTTDDKKVRSLLAKLHRITAVDFLMGLRNIEGNISFPTGPSTWVKREDIPKLLELAKLDVRVPRINQYIVTNYKKFNQDLMYVKTSMTDVALDLIYGHIRGYFPTAGRLTPTFESVNAWYQSGKTREEYRMALKVPPSAFDQSSGIEKKIFKKREQ